MTMARLSQYDAIVIGGGPAGASVALPLAQLGWSVAVVEKNAFPRRKVCGEYMSASNLALLDRLQVGDAWRANAGPEIRRVGFYSGETRTEAKMPLAKGGFGRALGRDILDLLLLQAARSAGANTFQPFRAVAIDQDGDVQAVRIQAKDETIVLHAPVIIAAHGSWEHGTLPSQLEKTSRPSDLLGFKAHFRGAKLDPDVMPLLRFPGGYGGMVMADHGRLSVSCCIRRDMLARLREGHVPAPDAVFHHLMRSCRGVREVLEPARLDGPWLASGPSRPGMRSCYEGDIFRVGNAAGEAHPIIAEGISMAMQSGWMLASELANAPSGRAGREAAGGRYERAWRALFAMRVHAAAAIARIALNSGGAALMGATIRTCPQALTLGAKLSGKTTLLPEFA
jgi:flavin-dependent dehydrogenase